MSAPAADAADIAEVAAVALAYAEACRDGDAERLAALFHPAAHMFGRIGRTTMAEPIAAFVEHVRMSPAPRMTEEAYRAWVGQVQVAGDTAVVTLEERGYQGRDYTDRFSMLRTDGRWTIVAKLFATAG